MTNTNIIRAWKDPNYRATLTDAPLHPSGIIELPDDMLMQSGGIESETLWSFGCCDSVTMDPVSGACVWYC
ncbi:mersacidin/lichenicidin family type 2 lantibiotic [Nonomuraea bangladeshensis]|uniref:Mersacidin/lichenicidin family type 2 lantibiotic n=1 Tax=Nonomuraea bangladeshensis TaxID=404385 RepID=A0ABV3HJR1_9ACTN|nr:mersacidin/lichenicidin family type 2 lantibiotic [Nonomuraea sp. LP-02]MED7929209.1 mersacidin/lichenicidin family type 2 lantibiotic [Nonomuraea sp. LP-02]